MASQMAPALTRARSKSAPGYGCRAGGDQLDHLQASAAWPRDRAASPIDIASSDRHTVKPWLDVKAGLSLPPVDLAARGFTLLGGRADVIGERVLPALVYRPREHLITMVADPGDGSVDLRRR